MGLGAVCRQLGLERASELAMNRTCENKPPLQFERPGCFPRRDDVNA
jgi:hypothetical protein